MGKKLTTEMIRVLSVMADGYSVHSRYDPLFCGTPSTAFWASLNCPHKQPRIQTIEALSARGLIEPYNDAAGITEEGKRALAAAQEAA